MSDSEHHGGFQTFKRSLPRVFARRCPQCNRGALFETRFRLCQACSECGLVYRREQGSMTGSMYLSAAITEIFAAMVAVGMFLLTDFSVALGLTVGIVLVALFSLWFHPYSKSIWVAVEYATDVSNKEDWVDPR